MYKNERILDPRYVPDALQCRDDEIEKLNRIIVKRVNSEIVPKHVMIVGSTGSGKTVCVYAKDCPLSWNHADDPQPLSERLHYWFRF